MGTKDKCLIHNLSPGNLELLEVDGFRLLLWLQMWHPLVVCKKVTLYG